MNGRASPWDRAGGDGRVARAGSPPGPLSSASDADVRADSSGQPDRIAAFRAAVTAQDRVCSA